MGADRDKLVKAIESLKSDLGDTQTNSVTPSTGAQMVPVVERYGMDLGFIAYNPRSTHLTKYENMKNLPKMGAKLKD